MLIAISRKSLLHGGALRLFPVSIAMLVMLFHLQTAVTRMKQVQGKITLPTMEVQLHAHYATLTILHRKRHLPMPQAPVSGA
jgi:hypothetical protein